jgi:hypothetical protein
MHNACRGCTDETKAQPKQEEELCKYINTLTERALSSTRIMVASSASQIRKNEVGMNWVSRFLKHYQDKLSPKWTTEMNRVDTRQTQRVSTVITSLYSITSWTSTRFCPRICTIWMKKASCLALLKDHSASSARLAGKLRK